MVTCNQAIFFNNFVAFNFLILSDLNFNPNNLVEILFIRVFLIDCLMCRDISLITLKIFSVFFARMNSYRLTSNLLFLGFCLFNS